MYRRVTSIAKMFDIGRSTVWELIREIRKSDRYSDDAIMKCGRITVCDVNVFKDYFRYRDQIELYPDTVPEYKGETETDGRREQDA